ncbi:hypothetical protein PYW07_015858 [Mythimna separata]|uniref:LITAF domain-containing protein n=1 Tax=Mythimna separata TaxID=271217 RepID=A0AAD8DUT6_MYTSE|nr:hypothetical protein PYW07_015858 [Mythimna separata]
MDTTQSAEIRPLLDIGLPQASPSDSRDPRQVVSPPCGKPSNAASSAKDQPPPPPYTASNPHQAVQNVDLQGPILVPVAQPGTGVPQTGAYIVQPTPYALAMVIGNQMGPEPMSITCPSCKEVIVTRIEARANTKTHTCAFVLCFMCCWPCVILPYFVNKCRNLDHYCPHCSSYIGSYVN